LLSRPELGVFLQEMWTEFDVILFDTPPAKLYADTQTVAFRAGNVVMLARKDHTRLADTTSVIRELSDTGVRVVGTVFNAY
jgi:Mrp family chromosome partitioning ATPase